MSDELRVSIVIPLFNEEESVDELVEEVTKVLDDNQITGEIKAVLGDITIGGLADQGVTSGAVAS